MSQSARKKAARRLEAVGGEGKPPATLKHQGIYERIVVGISGVLPANDGCRIVLTVGANSGDGASTVARGLAQVVGARESTQVLLIDGNLRSPSLHEVYGVVRGRGLSDVARREVDLESAIDHDVAPGVSLLTCGREVRSPVEVLDSAVLGSALSALRSRYDWIVIDGPPPMQFTDSEILAGLADGVLLVLRAEHTRTEVADEVRKRLALTGSPVVGAVLNRRRFHIPQSVYRWI